MDRVEPSPDGPEQMANALVEPFSSAVSLTLSEMTGTEVAVRGVSRGPLPAELGDVTAVLELFGAPEGPLVLSFPARTASALAGRALAEVTSSPDEEMIRDCIGEFGNIVAGQAKALLFGTPHAFTFTTPTVTAGPLPAAPPGRQFLMIAFVSDSGEFTLCVGLGEGSPG
ncbi:MAG: chemotaxis protein CheX [Gemmataceae bacterium]|nr:chemotaxis protein CheX [Gemmataceae bacterium]